MSVEDVAQKLRCNNIEKFGLYRAEEVVCVAIPLKCTVVLGDALLARQDGAARTRDGRTKTVLLAP